MATVLATGAYLKNRAALWTDDGWTLSDEHGGLGTPAACLALEASVERWLAQAGGRVDAVAHDLHPDFHSTRVALAVAQRLGAPAIGVQHHHAHIAVVLAEQRLDGPVVGLALDGVGLGTDGQAWGGEVLAVDAGGFARLGHLRPLALPGGDRAAREPWRMAAAALHALGRGDEIEPRYGPRVGAAAARGVAQMLARGLNCPPSSAAGRWFDAAAGALGLALHQTQDAEAAVALERLAAAEAHDGDVLPLPVSDGVIEGAPLMQRLFECADAGRIAEGAALFHRSLADALASAAVAAAGRLGTGNVVFGGGCFFNRVLGARLTRRLQEAGLAVHRPRAVSCGDAGLALGQAWVAAHCLAAPRTHHPEESAACA
jgi:hydrogenase maturation protein HypF